MRFVRRLFHHPTPRRMSASRPRFPRASLARLVRLAGALVGCGGALAAQEPEHAGHHDPDRPPPASPASRSARLGVQAIALATRLGPKPLGGTITEGYLTQPNVMGHAALLGGGVRFTGTLNLEALTLRRGELNAGAFGESYVDRRHPHTVVHEAMAALVTRVGPVGLSVAGGKGFVPFGTDDPMMRPFAKYPLNHHYAQLLERAQVVGGVRWRGLLVEGARFNGDEPTGPEAAPRRDRFADSWAARLTLLPGAGIELQGSVARVESPEQALGGGLDQDKASASARWAPPSGDRYVLAEWAHTEEVDEGRVAFGFTTLLAEGGARWRGLDLALRLERTDRPEDERLDDLFRTPVPHHDESILGLTRWSGATVVVSAPGLPWGVARAGWRAAPFVEATWHRVASLLPGAVFQPAAFYGSDRIASLSLGVRLRVGPQHARMGRYGVADDGHGGSH